MNARLEPSMVAARIQGAEPGEQIAFVRDEIRTPSSQGHFMLHPGTSGYSKSENVLGQIPRSSDAIMAHQAASVVAGAVYDRPQYLGLMILGRS
jgi:hypothetical protein